MVTFGLVNCGFTSVILGQIAQFTIKVCIMLQDHSRVGFMHTSPHPTEVYIQTTAFMWIIQLQIYKN